MAGVRLTQFCPFMLPRHSNHSLNPNKKRSILYILALGELDILRIHEGNLGKPRG